MSQSSCSMKISLLLLSFIIFHGPLLCSQHNYHPNPNMITGTASCTKFPSKLSPHSPPFIPSQSYEQSQRPESDQPYPNRLHLNYDEKKLFTHYASILSLFDGTHVECKQQKSYLKVHPLPGTSPRERRSLIQSALDSHIIFNHPIEVADPQHQRCIEHRMMITKQEDPVVPPHPAHMCLVICRSAYESKQGTKVSDTLLCAAPISLEPVTSTDERSSVMFKSKYSDKKPRFPFMPDPSFSTWQP